MSRCHSCGQANPQESRYCVQCGRLIDSSWWPASAAPSSPPVEVPGDLREIAGFVLQELLGQGGMGRVYRAIHKETGQVVAIKMLDPLQAGDTAARRQLQREASILSSLRHPHIVILHAILKENDHLALAMELLEGETLADRLRRGPLPPDEALSLCKDALGALSLAHQRGIVHLDLKPTNLFLCQSPSHPKPLLKIMDFGIARIRDEVLSSTIGRRIEEAGTLPYMAPEQLHRQKEISPKTDLYSLATILYEMLAGQRMIPSSSPHAMLYEILESPQPPPPSLLPHIFLSWFETLRHRDPAYRFSDADHALAAWPETTASSPSSSFLPPFSSPPSASLEPSSSSRPSSSPPTPIATLAYVASIPLPSLPLSPKTTASSLTLPFAPAPPSYSLLPSSPTPSSAFLPSPAPTPVSASAPAPASLSTPVPPPSPSEPPSIPEAPSLPPASFPAITSGTSADSFLPVPLHTPERRPSHSLSTSAHSLSTPLVEPLSPSSVIPKRGISLSTDMMEPHPSHSLSLPFDDLPQRPRSSSSSFSLLGFLFCFLLGGGVVFYWPLLSALLTKTFSPKPSTSPASPDTRPTQASLSTPPEPSSPRSNPPAEVSWQPPEPPSFAEMTMIPAGWFLAGGRGGSKPIRWEKLPTFWLDRFEVSNRQYLACVRAKPCRPSLFAEKPPFSKLDHPVVGVSWKDADTFCRSQKKRLPSPLEWEKAARGEQGQLFPFADLLPACHLAVYGFSTQRSRDCPHNPDHPRPSTAISPDRSPYGVFHLAGNVREWVDGCLQKKGDICLRREVRGGSWRTSAAFLLASRSLSLPSSRRLNDIGFRCAWP